MLTEPVGELADRRGLAGAVDTDDEDDTGLAFELDARRLAEELRDFLGEGVVQLAEIRPALEPADELRRRRHADVARDQRLLEPLPRRRVAGIEGRGGKLLGERAAAASERVPEPREEAGALLRLGHGAAVAEQVSPSPGHGDER